LQDIIHSHVPRSQRTKEKNTELTLSQKTAHENSGGKSIAFEEAAEEEELIQYSQNGTIT
jgi:hypothetical protein